MKIIAVRLARAIWLMPPYFLNPRGTYLRPVNDAIKERYGFATTPFDRPMPSPTDKAVKFEYGAFKGANGTVQITSLTMHEDGIVIDTRSSTDDADSFMEDLVNWAHKEHGFAALSELPPKRIYVSELNVRFKQLPKIINPKLIDFEKDLNGVFGGGNAGDVGFLSFLLGTDQSLTKNPLQFRIDREINTAFSENRFYSFASTKTNIHIGLLEKLEKLVA